MKAYETFDTPMGEFTVLVNEAGQIVAAAFGGIDAAPIARTGEDLVRDASRTAMARSQVEAYFAGERTEFDLPLAPAATDFQERYRREMASLRFGETLTYGELARRLGTSARAAGRANATNPLCLIVPCHRVIGAGGSLTGYAYGLDTKRLLLEHEKANALTPALL